MHEVFAIDKDQFDCDSRSTLDEVLRVEHCQPHSAKFSFQPKLTLEPSEFTNAYKVKSWLADNLFKPQSQFNSFLDCPLHLDFDCIQIRLTSRSLGDKLHSTQQL